MSQPELAELRRHLGEIADINSAIALLQWDQETYMPPRAAPGRGQQLATLSALAHRMFTAPAVGDLLKGLHDRAGNLTAADAKLVDVTLYDYERAKKLPESFVQEFEREKSKGYESWVKARKENDFPSFEPSLTRLIELQKQKAEYLGYEGSPYNALLEDYERGMTTDALRDIFDVLAQRQSALVKRIVNASRQPDTRWLERDWDEKQQWELTMRIVRDMGYDLDAGRQDRAVHPFTTSFDLYDVRITTRFDSRSPFSALMGSMHEGGHALYEQGFRPEDRRTPVADGTSLGIHESQSRLWENLIGRSLPFWKHYTAILQEHFPGHLDRITPDHVYSTLNRVSPSLIRVEADECTYNLHIIIRFEIEVGLLEGEIQVSEIPEVWNERVKQYLGLEVPDDTQGCLQDIHWSHGCMGYFPTYALGNLYASQLFEKIQEDVPGLWEQVEAAEFSGLLQWLRSHIHQYGRRKSAPELIRDITGREPSSAAYLEYLEGKYGGLYGLS